MNFQCMSCKRGYMQNVPSCPNCGSNRIMMGYSPPNTTPISNSIVLNAYIPVDEIHFVQGNRVYKYRVTANGLQELP